MTRSRLFVLLLFAVGLAPATLIGCVAQSAVGSADDHIDEICAKAGIREIVGATPEKASGLMICSAATAEPVMSNLFVAAHARYPLSLARTEHDQECKAMATAGTVEHPAIGDEACLITEDGRVRITTVIVRKGSLHIGVRYATAAKDATAVEQTALDVARRLAR